LCRERTSARQSRIAAASGVVLAAWAIVATMLAGRGFLEQRDANSVPPVGITLALVLLTLAVCLLVSPSLSRIVTARLKSSADGPPLSRSYHRSNADPAR
jgi:hypothetical protein